MEILNPTIVSTLGQIRRPWLTCSAFNYGVIRFLSLDILVTLSTLCNMVLKVEIDAANTYHLWSFQHESINFVIDIELLKPKSTDPVKLNAWKVWGVGLYIIIVLFTTYPINQIIKMNKNKCSSLDLNQGIRSSRSPSLAPFINKCEVQLLVSLLGSVACHLFIVRPHELWITGTMEIMKNIIRPRH